MSAKGIQRRCVVAMSEVRVPVSFWLMEKCTVLCRFVRVTSRPKGQSILKLQDDDLRPMLVGEFHYNGEIWSLPGFCLLSFACCCVFWIRVAGSLMYNNLFHWVIGVESDSDGTAPTMAATLTFQATDSLIRRPLSILTIISWECFQRGRILEGLKRCVAVEGLQ